jgi:four helix bundle protein
MSFQCHECHERRECHECQLRTTASEIFEFAMQRRVRTIQAMPTNVLTTGKMTNLEFAVQMQKRTKAFAIRIIRFFQRLPKTDEARLVGRQLLRSGTGVASNYRAACRSKSRADFVAKLGTAVEEADETIFWLELLEESGIVQGDDELQALKVEAGDLLRILSRSLGTAKRGG